VLVLGLRCAGMTARSGWQGPAPPTGNGRRIFGSYIQIIYIQIIGRAMPQGGYVPNEKAPQSPPPALPADPGMCGGCRYASVKATHRGTAYLRCTRSAWDERLPKYPRLPVQDCPGFARDDGLARLSVPAPKLSLMAESRLSVRDRELFLAEPHIAALSVSAGPERGPLTVPMWYQYTPGGELWVLTEAASRKARLTDLGPS
jgi:hypothetical protein